MIDNILLKNNDVLKNEVFQHTLDSLDELFCLYNPDFEIIWTNKAAADSLGLEKEELIGKHCYELWGQQNTNCNDCPVMKALETKKSQTIEKMTPDGRYWQLQGSVVFNDDGSPRYLVELGMDITEKKKSKLAYHESERKLQNLLKSTSEFIWQVDNNGVYTFVSDTAEDIIGYNKSEIIGKTPFDFMEPSEAERVGNIFSKIVKQNKNIIRLEDTMIHKNGAPVFFETDGTPLFDETGERYGYFGICRDITEQKKSEEELKEAKQRYRNLFMNAQVGLFQTDLSTGKMLEANDALADFAGYDSREKLLADEYNIAEHYVNPEDRKRLINQLKQQGEVHNFEAPFKRLDGSILWIRFSAKISEDKTCIEGVSEDVTDQKNAEDALKESEERFRNLSELLPEAIVETDADLTITYANNQAFKLMGYSESDFKDGINAMDLFASEEHFRAKENIARRLKQNDFGSVEYKARRKNGETIPVLVHSRPMMKNEVFKGFRGIIVDISKRKKAEKKISDLKLFYEQILDNVHDGIWVTDEHDYFIYVNPGMERIAGIKAEELKGLHLIYDLPNETTKHFLKYYMFAKKQGTPQEYEAEVITLSGRKSVQTGWLIPRFDEDRYQGMICTISDITEQKKAQHELLESKKRLDLALKGGDLGTWDWNIKTNEVRFNDRWAEMKGYEPDQIEPHLSSWEQLVHPEDLPAVRSILKDHLEGKTSFYEAVFRIQHKSGEWIWILDKGKVIEWDEQGNPLRACGTNLNITKQKRTEKELKLTLDATTDGIWTWNFKENKLFFSDRYYSMLGYEPQEFEATYENWVNLIHPLDREKALQTAENYLETKPDLYENEFRLKTKDGGYRWIRTKAKVVERDRFGEAVRMIGHHEDITNRKEAQVAVIESEQKFRELFNNALVGIAVHEPNGKIVAVNSTAEHIFGLSEGKLQQKDATFWEEKLLDSNGDPLDLSEFPFSIVTQSKSPSEGKIIGFVQRDNDSQDIRWFLNSARPIFNSEGNVDKVVTSFVEITDRKQAEESLRKSEERNRLLFNAVPTGVGIAGFDGTLLRINDVFCDMLGFSKEELSHMNVTNLYVRKNQRDEFLQLLKKKGCIREYELQLQRKDGSIGIFLVNSDIIQYDTEKVLLTSARDITYLKRTQQELEKTHKELVELNKTLETKVDERTDQVKQLLRQKDEFINQLGHDLKNPLGPFLQLLPILKNHVADEKDKRMLSVLNRNANYMRNLVKKTIDLAKLNSSKTRFSFEKVSLSDLVDEVVAVNSSLFENHEVVVENNVSSDCLVHVDPFHIQEVFTNLFNNAVKYSEDKRWIDVDAVEKDDCVLVSVRDKGVGISEEQLPFLFDEYYKADSSRHDFDSSGLGLPICKRIVEKHGGEIWAESEGLGKGSTFYFTLPTSNK